MLKSIFIEEFKSVEHTFVLSFATLFHRRLIVWSLSNHITAAPYARPMILLPVQSASLLSQWVAPRLLQLHPPSVICTSTRMRPAWVICVKIRQIKKYNVRESGLLSPGYWIQRRQKRCSLCTLLFLVGNHIHRVTTQWAQASPKWKTKAVMTICNINLIGLTVSQGLLQPDSSATCGCVLIRLH